eukprot:513754-Amphidinium_carterae.1
MALPQPSCKAAPQIQLPPEGIMLQTFERERGKVFEKPESQFSDSHGKTRGCKPGNGHGPPLGSMRFCAAGGVDATLRRVLREDGSHSFWVGPQTHPRAVHVATCKFLPPR